jgi:hypothetical protein
MWYILFLEMTDFNYVTGSGGENIYSGKSAGINLGVNSFI